MPLVRLWAGMRTRNDLDDSGTDSLIELTINDNGGNDVLHHTFPADTDQDDLEAGQANLYEVSNVERNNIIVGDLNPSSIRLGIRGDDAWAPADILVFGEDDTNADGQPGGPIRPLPLAWARDITEVLSTDSSEASGDARLSIPIRRARLGDSTMDILRLLLLMETDSDGTDSRVTLRIALPTSDDVFFIMPRLAPQDGSSQQQQEASQANFFYIDLDSPIQKAAISEITLNLEGDDSWLPKRLFLFGLDQLSVLDPTSPDAQNPAVTPLVHLPEWQFGPITGETGLPLSQ